MAKKKDNLHAWADSLIRHPEVKVHLMDDGSVYVGFKRKCWLLEKYKRSVVCRLEAEDGSLHAPCFMYMKEFINIHIEGSKSLPENWGKLWEKSDLDLIVDLVEIGLSLNQISNELGRTHKSVCFKIAYLFSCWSFERLDEEHYDAPVSESLHRLDEESRNRISRQENPHGLEGGHWITGSTLDWHCQRWLKVE